MVADLNHPAFAAAFLNSDDKALLCDTSGRIIGISDALLETCSGLTDRVVGQTLHITSSAYNREQQWHIGLSSMHRPTQIRGEASFDDGISLNPLNLITIYPLTIQRQLTGYRIVFESTASFERSLPPSAWHQLFDNNQIGIGLFDETFRVLSSNSTFAQLTAIQSDESVKIHEIISVEGSFQNWLLRSRSLSAEAQLIRNPDQPAHIAVTSIEHFGQQLFWVGINPLDKALQQGSGHLNQRFNENTNGVALVSADGRFVDANRQFAELLKRSRDDIIGQPFTRFNAPGSYELSKDDAQQFVQSGFSLPFEKQLVRGDGQIVDVQVQLVSDTDADGQYAGAWNFIQPIKPDSRDAINRERYLQRFLTDNQDPIVLTDLNNRVLMVNPALGELLQAEPEALIGTDFHQFVRREDAQLEQRLHRPMLLKQGHTDLYEQRITRTDLPDVPVSVRRCLIRNHRGQPEAIWTIMRDASVQHKLISSLANAERRFRSLFSNSIDAIAFWTQTDELRYANRAYLDLVGYSQEELRHLTYHDFTPPGWEEADRLMAEQIATRGYTDIFEKEVLRKDGSLVPITLRASSVRGETGNITGSWVIIRDISELKETLRRLQHSENMLQQTSRMSRVGGWELNVKDMLFTLTEETFQLLSIPRSFHTSVRNIAKLFDVNSEEEAIRRVQRVYKTGSSETIEMKLAGFSPERWVRVSAQLGFEDQGTPYVYGAIQDISEFIKQQRSLESARDTYQQLAFHDPLTKLPNRLLMKDRFQQISGQARRDNNQVALMVIDLDDFKDINDRHGHPAGDALLIDIAQRLQGTIRASDTVARLGGDEFIIIAMIAEPSQAHKLAEKIGDSINRPFTWKKHTLQSACSVGIALMTSEEDTFENLYARADQALYTVKSGEKGTFQINLSDPESSQS
ncbi:PAS domain S-box protein [Reinekea blandensis]|uniref:Uncharacterized protein n=1 Tax=Reinekea blandensis MED297 TaxID=314283 RepID=A4BE88_9GAMM|nr:PAS domain S-box protein [Reinekea blandensis]EAR09566.1 hypothetical protein MED297_12582 [Reinekea blandensis MED297]